MNEGKPLAGGVAGREARGAAAAPGTQGRPAQVDPIKPTMKAPGTKLLKLDFDELLSSFAFKFDLRRYTKAVLPPLAALGGSSIR